MENTQPVMDRLNIDQVCIVVKDIEKSISQLSSLFNIGPWRRMVMDAPDSILHGKQTPLKAQLAFANIGPVELELIEPGEGESNYTDFLNAKGEGVHHLRVIVSDMENDMAKFKENGIEPLQHGENPNVKFAYMDTEGVAGVIIELVQWKPRSS